MSQATIPTDLYVSGNLAAKSFSPPAACITDAAVVGAAGVQASKLQHQYEIHHAQQSNVNAAADQTIKHVVKGATATLLEFAAGAVVLLTGADTCTVDLLKNGTTILTAAIALAAGDTIRVMKTAAGYTNTALVVGDVLEVKITPNHTSGTLPQGVFARITIREDAQ